MRKLIASHPHLRAIFYALAGFSLWVTGDTALKLIGPNSPPKYQVMAGGSLGGLIIILLATLLRRKIERLKPQHISGLLIQGMLNLVSYATWLVALPHLPLANCYIVMFLSPIMIAIFAAILLGEHLKWADGIAIIFGFAGVIIAVNPQQLIQNHSDLISYGSVFVAMVATALQMVLLRVLGRRETRESTVLYPRIVTILGGVIAAFLWGFEPMSSRAVFCSLLSGVLGGTGWLCMAEAYKTAPAATVAPFHYSQIITGAFIGYLIWGDIPSYGLLAGAALIILSGIYIVTHVRKSANILREETHT